MASIHGCAVTADGKKVELAEATLANTVYFEIHDPTTNPGTVLGTLRSGLVIAFASDGAGASFDLALPFARDQPAARLRAKLACQGAGNWTLTFINQGGGGDLFRTFFAAGAGYAGQEYKAASQFKLKLGEWLTNSRGGAPGSSAQQLPPAYLYHPVDEYWLHHVPAGLVNVQQGRGFHNIGVFSWSRGGRVAELVVCVVPVVDETRGTWLSLAGLENWELDQRQPSLQHLLYFSLGAGVDAASEWKPQWEVVAQVPPFDGLGVDPRVRRTRGGVIDPDTHPIAMLFDPWNEAVQAIQAGKPRHAGQPFLPLPLLSIVRGARGDSAVPAFRIASTLTGSEWKTTLMQAGVHRHTDDHTVHLAFLFEGPTPFAGGTLKPPPSGGKVLNIKGRFKSPLAWKPAIAQGLPRPAELLSKREVEDRWSAAGTEGADDDVVTSFDLELRDVVEAASFRFGSLEFNFGAGALADAAATCRLRGSWSGSERDLYPEIDLALPCRMRMAPTDDSPPSELTAVFDIDSLGEDALQRESSAILSRANAADYPYQGTLRVRMISRLGQHPATELTFRQTAAPTAAVPTFYLNPKPFTVALLDPVKFDPEAGDLLAEWHSTDPAGPQWRFGMRSVDFQFPPQAVGEAMERGNRFWSGTTPDIKPNEIIPYRFSRSTRMTVRPGTVDRRYLPNPANLREILRQADVRSFRAEMVYPLEITFKADAENRPLVRVSEAAEFFGDPPQNLPVPAETTIEVGQPSQRKILDRSTTQLFSGAMSRWVREHPELLPRLKFTRGSHAAARASFVSRMGTYVLYDPLKENRQLGLREGLEFTIRGPATGDAPAANPMPADTSLSPAQMEEIVLFLGGGAWSTPASGPLKGGILHTFEFPSELAAVLRTPRSAQGEIHQLSLSALGARGSMEASFDEGRTTFAPTVQNGQLSRLVKTRIGRVGVCWNVAKHVIIYERSTVPSRQFEKEQGHTLDGWPVLRKTEEYVDILEPRRFFSQEASADENRTACVVASAFVTKRIYVNGAWGRDLGHGYELPLWNPDDDLTLYPKPVHVLEGDESPEDRARHINDCPQHLYFYSNTQAGTGSDPNRWEPKRNVDTCNLNDQAKREMKPVAPKDLLNGKNRQLAGGLGLPPRFNFRLIPESPMNLQRGRGDKPMLAKLHEAYLTRSGDFETKEPPESIKQLVDSLPTTGVVTGDELLNRLRLKAEALLKQPGDCAAIRDQLQKCVNNEFAAARAHLVTPWAIPKDADFLIARLGKDVKAAVAVNRAALLTLVEKWRAALAHVKAAPAASKEAARKALAKSLADAKAYIFDVAGADTKGILSAPGRLLSGADTAFAQAVKDIDDAHTIVAAIDLTKLTTEKQIQAAVEKATDQLGIARTALGKVTTPQLQPHVGRLRDALQLAERVVSQAGALAKAIVEDKTLELRKRAIEFLASAASSVNAIAGAVELLKAGVAAAAAAAVDGLQALATKLDDVVDDLGSDAPDVIARGIRGCEALIGPQASGDGLLIDWVLERALKAEEKLSGALGALQERLEELDTAVQEAQSKLKSAIELGLDAVKVEVDKLVQTLFQTCDDLQKKLRTLEEKVEEWVDRHERELTTAIADFANSEVARRIAQFAEQAQLAYDKGSPAIKLARAFATMPKLPELSFDISKGEMAFVELERDIRTSPYVAKLREMQGHVQDLGIALPCMNLTEQFKPLANWGNVRFDEVMKDLGGILPRGGLLDFVVPDFLKEEVEMTHHFDPQTRSGWAKVRLNKSLGQRKAFGIGPVDVSVGQMVISGAKDVAMNPDGTITSSGFGRLKGDWILGFSGQPIVTFRSVAIEYNGGDGFTFDVNPSNIELHPTLKFVSDLAQQFSEKIPPNIEILRDATGRPSGVSASFLTPVKDLPPIGTLKIGPFDIASGLGLAIRKAGSFEISAHVRLGSRSKPVFIEVNKLGGGFFIEARATYEDGKIVPSASLGMALGSQESFNLAGVARGSYSIMFFAYLTVGGTSSSFAVGVAMSGSARILGICNASISLLLEARQEGGGKMVGHGELDVSVEICWCYTLHVHQQVEHTF